MARASAMKGKAPRLTAKRFAEQTGVELGDIRRFQKMAKSYNDAARKWAARYNYEGNLWRPWTLNAMMQSRSKTPGEAFRYAMEELQDRLRDGVSNLLNATKHKYVENLISAIATSSQFLLDRDLQRIVNGYQSGKITEDQIYRATGGVDLALLYISNDDTRGDVDYDFSPVIDRFISAGLL